MASERQDYLLRQIALLRQFVVRLKGRPDERDFEEALLLSFHLQEKLFPVPPAEFLALDLPAQIDALRRNESPADAREKCLTYAGLLAETANLYEFKGGRDDLAAGARQMALYAALCAALEGGASDEASALVGKLSGTLDPETLHAPVAELLEEFRKGA